MKKISRLTDMMLSWCIERKYSELLVFLLLCDYLRGNQRYVQEEDIKAELRKFNYKDNYIRQILFRMRTIETYRFCFTWNETRKRFYFTSKHVVAQFFSTVPLNARREYKHDINIASLYGKPRFEILGILAYNRLFRDDKFMFLTREKIKEYTGLCVASQLKIEKILELDIKVDAQFSKIPESKIPLEFLQNKDKTKLIKCTAIGGKVRYKVQLPNSFKFYEGSKIIITKKIKGKAANKKILINTDVAALDKGKETFISPWGKNLNEYESINEIGANVTLNKVVRTIDAMTDKCFEVFNLEGKSKGVAYYKDFTQRIFEIGTAFLEEYILKPQYRFSLDGG